MRKISSIISIVIFLLFVTISCSEKDDLIIEDNDKINENKYVNDWIYKEMNIYYLWNDKIPKKPDYTLAPDLFFKSLLNQYNKDTNPNGDRFSWIDDDYTNLLGSLSGIKSDEIGFDYIFVATNDTRNEYYALVTYPKKGSDAYIKGIDRGRFITKVDGKIITKENYRVVFSGTGSKTLSMKDYIYNNQTQKYTLTDAADVTIRMEKDFAETPVYLDTVYTEISKDKKIGYMVYNFFATDKGDNSHDYDRLLMDRLKSIKDKGATEMILDLRYNGGGAVSTAIALASALVKGRSIKNVLVTAEYNALVDSELKKEEGANYNKDYFIDKIAGTSIVVPALDLPRLYVLVTGGSASASELIINGLKPYMDVVLIGETTYGKNVGSISIYEKNDPKNKWGMQPIIVKYSNSAGNSDFTAGFKPNFEVDELEALNLRLVEFGNTDDPLLSVALNQITGGVQTRTMRMNRQIATTPEMNEVKGTNSNMLEKSKFEMYDDVRGETIKKLMKK